MSENQNINEMLEDEAIEQEKKGIEEKARKAGLAGKLDYSLETPEERVELVKKVVAEIPPDQMKNRYLEILSDYIIFAMNKEERKQKKILTDNRMITVRKRETSLQGLADTLENGEDGIYNMIANDKNIIFTPKISITDEDIETIPGLKELRESIDQVEAECKAATGKKKYALKKQLIEMRQDQYVLKSEYKPTLSYVGGAHSLANMDLSEHITIGEDGLPHSDGLVSLFNPQHISALLCNYSQLKEYSWGNFESDSYYLMEDLDNLIEKTLKDKHPDYYDLLIYKIDGKSNQEIQQLLKEKYGSTHSEQYLSYLWRNKIPKLLAEQEIDDYLVWYYTFKEKGQWKKCSRCGEVKLAHNRFFSKNNTSRDGYYSICKECRNNKKKQKEVVE